MIEFIKEWLAQRATNFVRIANKVSRMSKGHAEAHIWRTYRKLYSKYGKKYVALDKLHYMCNTKLKDNNRCFSFNWGSTPVSDTREKWELSCINNATPSKKKVLFSVIARKER